jgi:hypothetical protein
MANQDRKPQTETLPPSGMDCRSVPGRLEWMGSGGVISANDSSVKNWKEKEALLPRGGD